MGERVEETRQATLRAIKLVTRDQTGSGGRSRFDKTTGTFWIKQESHPAAIHPAGISESCKGAVVLCGIDGEDAPASKARRVGDKNGPVPEKS